MSPLQKSWLQTGGICIAGGFVAGCIQGKAAIDAFAYSTATTCGVCLGVVLTFLGVLALLDWWALKPIKSRMLKPTPILRTSSKDLRAVLDGQCVKCPMCGATWHKSAIPEGLKSHVE